LLIAHCQLPAFIISYPLISYQLSTNVRSLPWPQPNQKTKTLKGKDHLPGKIPEVSQETTPATFSKGRHCLTPIPHRAQNKSFRQGIPTAPGKW
jgi:hypothetical protein